LTFELRESKLIGMWQHATLESVQILSWKSTPAAMGFPESALRELEVMVSDNPNQHWVIDAHGIPLLTSESIALLIGVVRKVGLNGGQMCLARPMPSVAAVLRMTRLIKLLPLFDDLPAAIASMRS
jgi:anti-anti-sigma factor